MKKSTYSVQKTYKALCNLELSLKALISASSPLSYEDKCNLYLIHDQIFNIYSKFRYDHINLFKTRKSRMMIGLRDSGKPTFDVPRKNLNEADAAY